MAKKKTKTIQWRDRYTETITVRADEVLPHPDNPKIHPDNQKNALTGLLDEVGKLDALKAYRSEAAGGQLVYFDGHCRADLRPDELWRVDLFDLTDEEVALVLVTFDPIGWQAEQSKQRLESLMETIRAKNSHVVEFLAEQGTRMGLVNQLNGYQGEPQDAPVEPAPTAPTLADRFIVPPFSVLDARQGYWQDRKRAWLSLGIQSELGRGSSAGDGLVMSETIQRLKPSADQALKHSKANAAPGGSLRPAMSLGKDGKTVRGDGAGKEMKGLARCFGQDLMRGEHEVGNKTNKLAPGGTGQNTCWLGVNGEDGNSGQSGTSIFDPVLCELAYRWFSPMDASILDPFAGGSVRGIVASVLGRSYTGVDLRPEQIQANRGQAKRITPKRMPKWLKGDSRNIDTIAPGEYDFIFSCPPYFDLEVYSDNPLDLSAMGYDEFLKAYEQVISQSVGMLKQDRFACFVVGDIRDKKGIYRNFVSETIRLFEAAGARLYNEAILVTSVGSLPIRVGRQFDAGRKLGKTHQNVLVFIKGDPKKATEACGKIEVFDPAEEFGEVFANAF